MLIFFKSIAMKQQGGLKCGKGTNLMPSGKLPV